MMGETVSGGTGVYSTRGGGGTVALGVDDTAAIAWGEGVLPAAVIGVVAQAGRSRVRMMKVMSNGTLRVVIGNWRLEIRDWYLGISHLLWGFFRVGCWDGKFFVIVSSSEKHILSLLQVKNETT
jgi:hypothetical protein